jgi:hypothetical protein
MIKHPLELQFIAKQGHQCTKLSDFDAPRNERVSTFGAPQ